MYIHIYLLITYDIAFGINYIWEKSANKTYGKVHVAFAAMFLGQGSVIHGMKTTGRFASVFYAYSISQP